MLINLAEIQKYRKIPSSIDLTRVSPFIQEAEELDIKPILNVCDEDFYQEILDNQNNSPYTLLLAGGEYTNKDGNKTSFIGLKAVIVYYTLARMVSSLDHVITNFGNVQKSINQSEPINERYKQNLIQDYRNIASGYFYQVKKYICDAQDQNSNVYPAFEAFHKRKKGAFGIIAVGGKRQTIITKDGNNRFI